MRIEAGGKFARRKRRHRPLSKYKTKCGLNNAFQKKFGNEKTAKIWAAVKPLLPEKA